MATKALTEVEVKKLKAGIQLSRNPERDWAICSLALSGLRIGETCVIRNGDLLTEEGKVKETFSLRASDTKNGKSRLCYITPAAKKAIEAYLPTKRSIEADRPFIESQVNIHEPMAANTAGQIVKKAMKSVGIESSSHSLRKYAATQLRKNGVDLCIIQRVLSHSSLAITQRYLQVDETEVESAMKNLKF
jgi:integrase/recombinase XerD